LFPKRPNALAEDVDSNRRGFRPMNSPLDGARQDIGLTGGRVVLYGNPGPDGSGNRPLLLVHSVNAAASAYEVKPLFDYYRGRRPVYAIDLPGFGQSDHSDRFYSVRTMTDAVLLALSEIRRIHNSPADAIALSLSCEFLARAAVEEPDLVMTLGFISPTGFEGVARDAEGGNRGKKWLHDILKFPLWRRSLFKMFTTKAVIRKFLEKTWGAKNIDESLLDYDYGTAHQSGAEFAPYYFIAGFLFSKDILNIYQTLRHPVWMVRGTRGDFVDYHHVPRVKNRPNWTFDVLDTGAFPQFEALSLLAASYDAFIGKSVGVSCSTHMPEVLDD
jgi:pimeloyl-ACP methyl ester carboxylesterase